LTDVSEVLTVSIVRAPSVNFYETTRRNIPEGCHLQAEMNFTGCFELVINENLHILLVAQGNISGRKFTLRIPTDTQSKEQRFQWRKPKRCRKIILLL
jgi:hypothetical protein